MNAQTTSRCTLRPVDLRCEYHTNPLALDVARPRLFWKLEASGRSVRQSAFQVLAASSAEILAAGQGDLWDSGKVTSDASVHVEYAGKDLKSGQRVNWKVRVWDAAGEVSNDSEVASWEMGMLQQGDWKAQWIGSQIMGGPRTTAPSPYLRKTFPVERKLKRARLYATALGIYECYLNGKNVSDEVFRPGWTEYRKRLQHDAYDVTALVAAGNNVIGAILGDGWYCGQVQALDRQFYGDRPKFMAQLLIEYEDGSSQWIVTDASWKTATGPILSGDMMAGESYDARLEMPGWSEAGFDDAEWTPAKKFADPGIPIVGRRGPAVRRITEIKPVESPNSMGKASFTAGYRGWLYDLGQNMVGRVRITVKGKRGMTLRLRYAEMLNKDGSLHTANLRSAAATDYYTLKGDTAETWEPRFTFHGFRYVEIASRSKDPFEILPEGVRGIVLHSDTAPTGEFECSDPLVNQLQRNIQWGQRGNFLEVPTDCPQRDERLGWTGDAQVFIRTAAFNMDVAAFFTKWQNDMADSQSDKGAFPMVVPNAGTGEDGGPAWADAGIICPWTIFQCYGDRRILSEHYGEFVKFLGFLQETSRDFLRCGEDLPGFAGFGDWLALDGSGQTKGGTPHELIGTAFFAHSSRLLSAIAGILGKNEDAEKYRRLFEKIREAFVRRFVTPGGLMASQTQTSYVLALHFDLLPAELRASAAEALVRDIKKRGNHLSTGFVGTPYLCEVLVSTGHADVAYDLLHQKTWPGWLYAVTQGATTIWERWDGWTHDKGFFDAGMNSFNHYAYGAIGEWLYRTVAGLDIDPQRPGYKHIMFRPTPGGGLTHAKAALLTLHGRAAIDWQIRDNRFAVNLEVPPNTTATAFIPAKDGELTENGKPAQHAEGVQSQKRQGDSVVVELGSGRYAFSARM